MKGYEKYQITILIIDYISLDLRLLKIKYSYLQSDHLQNREWFYSVVVITLGSDPGDPGSSPGRTFIF